jgi:NADH-quinone oxidoreductase subunit H
VTPYWLAETLKAGVLAVLVTLFVSTNALFLVWLERKVSARIQLRRGPLYVGPAGLLQTLADAVKLISKELTTPRQANRPLFVLGPLLVFAPVLGSFLVLPFGPGAVIKDLNIGFLLVFALSSVAFIGIFTSGWSSNNKFAALGAMRAVAQNISYEIPLLLSVMGVTLLAGTMRLGAIVEAQERLWFIVLQPVAFLIFLCAVLGETNRAPFDIPEAESELVAGFHTEYSGFRFALFFLEEYTNVFVGSALAATLFLGGWQGPLLPGPFWFLLKTNGIVFVVMWIRWTFPRLRSDQLIALGWKVLIPFGILNVLGTALLAPYAAAWLRP